MAREVASRPGSEQTRERILVVAERLFSEMGFDGVSMRQIGTEAEVPFALVTYHFKTKLGVYQAVFRRRIAEFRERRQSSLQQVVIGPDAHDNFHAIAAAFVGPMMRLREMLDGAQFSQLLAREIFDPAESARGVVAEHLDPLAKLTIDLLQHAAPAATRAEIARAYHFATGALAVNHAGNERLKRISGLDDRMLEADDGTDQLVHFIAAGLLAALRPELLARRSELAQALPQGKEALPAKKKKSASAGEPGRSPASQRRLAPVT